MPKIPSDTWFDSTAALLKDGNLFISKRCERNQTDVFSTRLMLKKTICMRGEEAARIFYDTNLFQRQGAAPSRAQKTLFGQGGVQGLDGDAHRHRKHMLMSLMTPDHIRTLANGVADQWHACIPKWEQMDDVQLFYEASEILCRAACAWAGVPLPEAEAKSRTLDFMALIDSAGAAGPRHWKGRRARKKMDGWLTNIIEQVRSGELNVRQGSAAQVLATHRDPDGKLLDPKVAAVELNNMIRPTIAIARFITFAALALHEHPQFRAQMQAGENEGITRFVQEVRRFYPFFPMVAAIVKKTFDWNDYHFPEGCWVILDLYGTNHDARVWAQPDEFRPERFRDWDGSPFNFIPQGGGDHYQNHRCAGEGVTIELMKVVLRMLTQEMEYDVPPQDLHIDPSRVPAIPESHFVLSNVHARQPVESATAKGARVISLH